jgi:putative transposase
VKHGLVERAGDWPWSSFRRYVDEGRYPSTCGDSDRRFPDNIGRE